MTTPPASPAAIRCPCLSGLPYDECCGPLHRGAAEAPSAERLMRSRYSAFALGDVAYVLKTWHRTTRPASLELDADIHWVRLDILSRNGGGMFDKTGIVQFRAHYRSPAGDGDQHETSRFVKEHRRWFYLNAAPPHKETR